MATMVQVSVRELKNHLSDYLRRASSGEEILVTNRGKALASLSRPREVAMTIDEKLDELERRGVLTRGRGKLRLPSRRVPLQGEGPSVSEMMLRDRGEPIS